VPCEPESPDSAYERLETRGRIRAAIQSLPHREQKVIGLYYYGEVTMKQIGAEIGVNESRVSQLHARAIRRLREALGDMNPQKMAEMKRQLLAFAAKKPMAKTDRLRMNPAATYVSETVAASPAVVLPYVTPAKAARSMAAVKKAAPAKAGLRVTRPAQAIAAAR